MTIFFYFFIFIITYIKNSFIFIISFHKKTVKRPLKNKVQSRQTQRQSNPSACPTARLCRRLYSRSSGLDCSHRCTLLHSSKLLSHVHYLFFRRRWCHLGAGRCPAVPAPHGLHVTASAPHKIWVVNRDKRFSHDDHHATRRVARPTPITKASK